MLKKVLTGVAIGLASFAITSAPSFAAVTDPGVLGTINSSGGTNASDGLKLDITYGQVQVGRKGDGQIFPHASLPCDNTYDCGPSSYPVVVLDDGTGTNHLIGDSPDWDSFTSEVTLTDSGRSGVVVNHLTYGSGTSLVTVDVTYTYTYPNQYFNVKVDLTSLGTDYAGWSHRLAWYVDSYLEGSDSGYQFGGTTPGGQTVAGVYNAAGTQIEAFRQVAGQSLNWFAGYYTCPYSSGTADECGVPTGSGFLEDFVDFPNVVASEPSTQDNGFGVNKGVSTASTDSMTFDLIFAECLNEAPLPCADSALGTASLPNTGASHVTLISLALSGTLLAALGVVLVAIRRQRA